MQIPHRLLLATIENQRANLNAALTLQQIQDFIEQEPAFKQHLESLVAQLRNIERSTTLHRSYYFLVRYRELDYWFKKVYTREIFDSFHVSINQVQQFFGRAITRTDAEWSKNMFYNLFSPGGDSLPFFYLLMYFYNGMNRHVPSALQPASFETVSDAYMNRLNINVNTLLKSLSEGHSYSSLEWLNPPYPNGIGHIINFRPDLLLVYTEEEYMKITDKRSHLKVPQTAPLGSL